MKRISNSQKEDEDAKIYLNIDHLKNGQYELQILLNNKVVKSVKIIK
ncbi:hypothetical protein [Bizionia arctica]|uniref:Uncharacterized protein n=1 Tax=Bizionia arctica TaxID=1495645 RepID=A0A917LN38_9FLAO|nr:hypothetical protein [Bizionia arctica]GGG44407.1 hypothetical protein GCM10010976_14990 [Bizionia arctica]